MRIIVATVVLTVATIYSLVTAQIDPHDNNLIAYPIFASAESTFYGQSGKLADFWSNWTGRDYADLTTSQNSWLPGVDQWTAADDAELKVYAASGANGLYLLFDVMDNSWVRPSDANADAVDFVLDKISANDIMTANPNDLYVYPSCGTTITYYSIQFQVNVGGPGLADYLYVNYFNGSKFTYNTVSLAKLSGDYNGLNLNLKVINNSERQLEMFIPWIWVGCGGGIGAVPASGTRIALSMGYNDQDSGMAPGTRKCLRWKLKDPFHTCDDLAPSSTYCDAWGDLEINGGMCKSLSKTGCMTRMNTIANTKKTSHPAGLTTFDCQTILNRSPTIRPKQMANRIIDIRYFTLHGKTISATSNSLSHSHGFVIRQDRLINGNIRTKVCLHSD